MGNSRPDGPPWSPRPHLVRIFHSHTISINETGSSYVLLLTSVVQRTEELILTSHAHPLQHFSMENQFFYGAVVTFCYNLGRSQIICSQFLQLLDSSGLSQHDERLASKSAWQLSLDKPIEPMSRTDILRRILHTEQIGYTNIGSFTYTATWHFKHILYSPFKC